jgi:hypothetical protein
MERHGYRSVVAERMRDQHQARVQARLERGGGARVAGARVAGADMAGEDETHSTSAHKPAAAKPPSLEDIRREARENWLRMRQSQGYAESAPSAARGRARDDDLAQ